MRLLTSHQLGKSGCDLLKELRPDPSNNKTPSMSAQQTLDILSVKPKFLGTINDYFRRWLIRWPKNKDDL